MPISHIIADDHLEKKINMSVKNNEYPSPFTKTALHSYHEVAMNGIKHMKPKIYWGFNIYLTRGVWCLMNSFAACYILVYLERLTLEWIMTLRKEDGAGVGVQLIN